jgi:hypothetical protein
VFASAHYGDSPHDLIEWAMFMRLDLDGSGRFKRGSPVTQEALIRDYRVDLRDPEARCKPWPRKLHCRRPLHNAFFEWYAANEGKFVIKLELLQHTGSCLEIGFSGIGRILTAHLIGNGLNVCVASQGTYWDTILDLDALPKRVPGGYVCGFCTAEHRRVFPSLEALWCDHFFEPFLEWVNGDLAGAETVSISGTPDWVGSARLVPRTGG